MRQFTVKVIFDAAFLKINSLTGTFQEVCPQIPSATIIIVDVFLVIIVTAIFKNEQEFSKF